MATTQPVRAFYFAVYAMLAVSCLQLLAAVEAKPLPAGNADGVDYNATSWENQTLPEDVCQCNSTNLTMMVDGNFLYKWRASFNTHMQDHSIRHLSEAARDLADCTIELQTKDCSYAYSKNFDLDYHHSQAVTHVLLTQFYNAFVLHKRFVKEKLLKLRIGNKYTRLLRKVHKELNKNIARLYHVLNTSDCDCVPNDCEQTNTALQQLNHSLTIEHCFEDYNIPISNVARKIWNDAGKLLEVIENLLEGNRNHAVEDSSFNHTQIEDDVKVENYVQTEYGVVVENQWCHY